MCSMGLIGKPTQLLCPPPKALSGAEQHEQTVACLLVSGRAQYSTNMPFSEAIKRVLMETIWDLTLLINFGLNNVVLK